MLRLSSWELFGQPVAEYWAILYALGLVSLMLCRPQGLLGNRELSDIPLFKRLFASRKGRAAK